MNISLADVGGVWGIPSLLVALGLGLWMVGLILTFGAGVLARPRLESLLRGER